MKKSNRYQIRFSYASTALMCIVIIFSLLFYSYIKRLDNTLMQENKERLSEVSEHVASYINILIKEQKSSLKIIAASVSSIEEKEKQVAYLGKMAEELGYEYIGIANEKGMLQAASFKQPLDISEEKYFKEALKGEVFVSNLTRLILFDKVVRGIIIADPVCPRQCK